jgi:hypothetical protein
VETSSTCAGIGWECKTCYQKRIDSAIQSAAEAKQNQMEAAARRELHREAFDKGIRNFFDRTDPK